jgi:hypothetical protein
MLSAGRGPISHVRKWPLDWRETSAAGLTLVLAALCLARGRAEEERPTAEASLQVGLPSAGERLMVSGLAGAREHQLRVQARTLRLTSFSSQPGQQAIPVVTLLIPVADSTCRALESSIAGICARGHSLSVPDVSVDWKRVASFRIGFTKPDSLGLAAGASAIGPQALPVWTLKPSAGGVRVSFECLSEDHFDLVLPSQPVSASCVPGGRLLRLRARAVAGEAPNLVFDGTKNLSLHVAGSEVGTVVDAGSLTVASETHEIRHSHEAVKLRATSSDLRVGMFDSILPQGDELTVTGPDVEAAEMDGDEQLPSRFEGLKNAWWVIFGTFLAFWLAALGAMLQARFRRGEEDA